MKTFDLVASALAAPKVLLVLVFWCSDASAGVGVLAVMLIAAAQERVVTSPAVARRRVSDSSLHLVIPPPANRYRKMGDGWQQSPLRTFTFPLLCRSNDRDRAAVYHRT